MTFQKTNTTEYPDALLKEAHGLVDLRTTLKQHNIPIKIPEIIAVDQHTLELERINQQSGSKHQWQQFGHALAELHLQAKHSYGWHENNYIGLNPQINGLSDNWGQFYFNHRLSYQISLIKNSNLQDQFRQTLDKVASELIDFLNRQCAHPSLLHGDLWSGNVLFDDAAVWLIDPAVYSGDADADLAMTELFGRFPPEFYQAYQATKPVSTHYPLKKVIYNLYHQLNHYNLFGSSYLAACEQGFEKLD